MRYKVELVTKGPHKGMWLWVLDASRVMLPRPQGGMRKPAARHGLCISQQVAEQQARRAAELHRRLGAEPQERIAA
jgi:hypothetical protein